MTHEELTSEVKTILESLSGRCHYDFIFRTKYQELYEEVLKATSFLDSQYPTAEIHFGTRLACVVNEVFETRICRNPKCNKPVDLLHAKLSKRIRVHCCQKCAGADPETLTTRRKTKTNRYGTPGWNNPDKAKETISKDPEFWNKRDQKSKTTKLKNYGDPNYVNMDAIRQTKLKNHGNPIWNNREKAAETLSKKTPEEKQAKIDKQVATRKKHAEEDPTFNARVLEKSIATRKRNHGEDYTGRAKCWNTCDDRYGVRNPWQIESVKDGIKKHNLEIYGVEYYSSTKECRNKVPATCLRDYGHPCYFGSEEGKAKLRQKNLDEHGVEHTWQREDVKETIRSTNRDLYGVDYPTQNPELRRLWQKRYVFEGVNFDSAPELAFYIWLRDSKIEFEYQPSVAFTYIFAGAKHIYQPDFKVGDIFFEIKGDHFFSSDGKMICPFKPKDWSDERYQEECAKYEAKHQCMLANNVVILTSSMYCIFELYVKSKYGETYLKSFKNVCCALVNT